MQNYINSGDKLEVTVPVGGYTSGAIVQVGEFIGVSTGTYAEGDTAIVYLKGAFDVAKASADVITQGSFLYFDATAGELTTDDGTGSNALAGYAFEAAAGGETIVRVKLKN